MSWTIHCSDHIMSEILELQSEMISLIFKFRVWFWSLFDEACDILDLLGINSLMLAAYCHSRKSGNPVF